MASTTTTNGPSSNGASNYNNGHIHRSASRNFAGQVPGDYNNNGNHSAVSSVVASSSEGWLELFLTPSEKYAFSQWNENVRDPSIVHSWSKPLFQYLAARLPESLAPNVITLTGFLSLGQAWYLTNAYGTMYPTACTILAVVNLCLFFITNFIAGYHADALRQHTSLSDLFKYACDMGSTIWLALLLTYCWLDPTDPTFLETQWYAVQASQLVLFLKHLSAYKRKACLRYRKIAGPGEVLMLCLLLVITPALFGKEAISKTYRRHKDVFVHIAVQIWSRVFLKSNTCVEVPEPREVATHVLMRLTYYILFISAVVQALLLSDKTKKSNPDAKKNKQKHGWLRFGLVTSLMMRLVPAMLLLAGGRNPTAMTTNTADATPFSLTVTDVICDGMFLTVLTFDLCLAKMANRGLHPWVVLMSLAAVLSTPVVLTLVVTYYIAVFSDLCSYLNLPLLATCRNVYCDGVYDLCHIGHKRAFQNALALGNRLLVGVVGDEDASHYKRPPIMSHAERCAEVEACKAVTQVIPNAPCFGLTEEFLNQYQIHVVAFGEEYLTKYPDPRDDPYYGYARQIGIGHTLPRTNIMSTTDLIERIHKAVVSKKSPT